MVVNRPGSTSSRGASRRIYDAWQIRRGGVRLEKERGSSSANNVLDPLLPVLLHCSFSLSLSLYRKFHGPRKEKETGQFVTNRALWAGGGFLEPSLCPRRESGSNFSVNNFYQTLLGVRRDGFLIEGDRTVVLWVLLLCDWSLRNYLDWTLFNQNFRSVSYQCTKRSSPFKVSDLKSLLN